MKRKKKPQTIAYGDAERLYKSYIYQISYELDPSSSSSQQTPLNTSLKVTAIGDKLVARVVTNAASTR